MYIYAFICTYMYLYVNNGKYIIYTMAFNKPCNACTHAKALQMINILCFNIITANTNALRRPSKVSMYYLRVSI